MNAVAGRIRNATMWEGREIAGEELRRELLIVKVWSPFLSAHDGHHRIYTRACMLSLMQASRKRMLMREGALPHLPMTETTGYMRMLSLMQASRKGSLFRSSSCSCRRGVTEEEVGVLAVGVLVGIAGGVTPSKGGTC